MKNVTRKIQFAMMLCAASAAYAMPAHAQQALSVHDPRPVAAMILELETRYSWQITYEDPPYASAADIEDVTARYARSPGGARILVPKAGSLSVSGLAGAPRESATIAQMLTSYNELAGAEAFRLVKEGELYHVVPNKAHDESGALRAAPSILEAKIAVRPGQRTMYDLLDEMCNKVSRASGMKVLLGTVPQSLLRNTSTTVGTAGRKETARAVLDQMIAQSGARLSWQLLYDPGDKFYALNLHVVPEKI